MFRLKKENLRIYEYKFWQATGGVADMHSMEVSPVQPENPPRNFTLLGMVMEVRPVQPEKASIPILVIKYTNFTVLLHRVSFQSIYTAKAEISFFLQILPFSNIMSC